ncbi:MAG: carboxypeptidase-like regulatory domain-containing protein [Bacteroides sp.]|nr:carboxypeptidase-like regulatory domain-containing protein [Bacteroides sp.]MCM1085293.1 carboxypeptidase-like regulatory domain-containing protein [Bacteroides sp.]
MKSFLLKLICFSSLCCFSVACNTETGKDKDRRFNDTHGCIRGTVTFFNTGEVTDAYVRLLLPGTQTAIYSCLINRTGNYRIDDVDTGHYEIRIFKQGFIDTVFPGMVYILPKSLTDGECWQMDCAISMLPPRMNLLEVNANIPLDTLDFGTTDTKLYFRIYNGSGHTCTWTSDFEDVKLQNNWLKSIDPPSGILKPNETGLVGIEIDRSIVGNSGFASGHKAAKFLIRSDNSGGCVLTVLAEIE